MKLTRKVDSVFAQDDCGGIVKIELDWQQDVTWERGELNDGYESIEDYFNSTLNAWYSCISDCISGDYPYTEFDDSELKLKEEETCEDCNGRPLDDRKPLMKSQTSDYSVFINNCNYLEDSVIGGSVPHSLYGVKINFCPVCGRKLGEVK
ncbi:hypothetical protein [Paenibacillus xylaniclasticus]|uniref:hypothetical protein n=1 Tax=Paenibacillus xylaniclasticus TaxID=588083 RepID=UPI00157F8636|nr:MULTISPECIES: hypothetical protein [Paenibacillus]GFN32485.1 hypothetical protein PCURB6_27450 [Paenibacillus curdlanolyticus]